MGWNPQTCKFPRKFVSTQTDYGGCRFPLKRDVERENNRRLALIQGVSHRFISLDSAGWDAAGNPISQDKAKKLLKDLIAPEEITLKVRLSFSNLSPFAAVNFVSFPPRLAHK